MAVVADRPGRDHDRETQRQRGSRAEVRAGRRATAPRAAETSVSAARSSTPAPVQQAARERARRRARAVVRRRADRSTRRRRRPNGQNTRFAVRVRRDPDERRIDGRDDGAGARGARARQPPRQARHDQDTPNAPTTDCATLTDVGTAVDDLAAAADERQEHRIARRAAERLDRAAAAPRRRRRSRGRPRGCARATGTPVRRASAADRSSRRGRTPVAGPGRRVAAAAIQRRVGRAAAPSRRVHRRPSERSAEICSETSPTRNTITANMISSTEELVMWLWVAIVHTAYAAPTQERRRRRSAERSGAD